MGVFDSVRFMWRNRGAVLRMGPRDTAAYKKAMAGYLAAHPVCQFCGKAGGKVEVHHVIPVSVDPTKAADVTNMVTLHRKPDCHMVVGHLGNFRDYNSNVARVCAVMVDEKTKKKVSLAEEEA